MNKIKLFIVDDHYMIIEGISSLLANVENIEIIGHAKDAHSCMAFLLLHKPDVIFLDINLPDKNGMDVCLDIKQKYPAIKVIALSTFNQNSFIKKILENGADGYLLKNAAKVEMIDAINAVTQNKRHLSKEVADNLKTNNDENLLLTRREKEILQLVTKGLTSTEMGKQLFISTTTVDTHRKHLLEKFKVNNTSSLIRKAQELGMI